MTLTCHQTSTQTTRPTARTPPRKPTGGAVVPRPRHDSARSTTQTSALPRQTSGPSQPRTASKRRAGKRRRSRPAGCGPSTSEDGRPRSDQQVDRSKDPPGSWHGDSNRILDRPINERVEAECDRIAERERETISPALRKVESSDPDRHLIGFEYRLKDRDGIKEKVAKSMAEKGLSAEAAISRVPDAIRYTLEYAEARYTEGVWADIARMKEQGFKLEVLKNSWSNDQYKGINSQWIEPRTGQHLELQFHTRISFEAKQITHAAYERLAHAPG